MAYNREIESAVDSIIKNWKNMEKKKMFGGICYLVKGNMCFGIYKECIIIRAGEETALKKLKEKHTRVFDITGKPMKAWFMVEPGGWEDTKSIQEWLLIGKKYALTLPPK